jgi:predicted Zn-dependent protease
MDERRPVVEKNGSAFRVEGTRDEQVRSLVRRTGAAIQAGKFGVAEALLESLEYFLPEQSLTVLRMRAWLDFSSGRDEAAIEAYQQILERVENDENAGINLAILVARAGDEEEAARILTNVSRHHPDSSQLAAVRRALGLSIDDSHYGIVFRE